MREIRTSGSMSGRWKRNKVMDYSGTGNRKGRQQTKPTPTPPRHLSLAMGESASECAWMFGVKPDLEDDHRGEGDSRAARSLLAGSTDFIWPVKVASRT